MNREIHTDAAAGTAPRAATTLATAAKMAVQTKAAAKAAAPSAFVLSSCFTFIFDF